MFHVFLVLVLTFDLHSELAREPTHELPNMSLHNRTYPNLSPRAPGSPTCKARLGVEAKRRSNALVFAFQLTNYNSPTYNLPGFFPFGGFTSFTCSRLSNSSRNSFTSLKSRYTDANLMYATLSSAFSPCMIIAPTSLVVRSRSGESIT